MSAYTFNSPDETSVAALPVHRGRKPRHIKDFFGSELSKSPASEPSDDTATTSTKSISKAFDSSHYPFACHSVRRYLKYDSVTPLEIALAVQKVTRLAYFLPNSDGYHNVRNLELLINASYALTNLLLKLNNE